MKNRQSFQALDIFRGLAAVWVVFFHIYIAAPVGIADAFIHFPLRSFFLRGQLGVCLFFVISGYCITASAFHLLLHQETSLHFFRSRVRRIYPPYLASLIFAAMVHELAIMIERALHYQINHAGVFPNTPKAWMANIFLLQVPLQTSFVLGVYWSLCYEIFFYLIVGLLLALALRVAKYHGLSTGVMVFILANFLLTVSTVLWLCFSPWALFPFDKWHYFALGGVLYFLLELSSLETSILSRTRRLWMMALASAPCAAVLVFVVMRQNIVETSFHTFESSRAWSILALSFAGFLYLLRRYGGRIDTQKILWPLVWLGSGSYSLYLSHRIFLPYVDMAGRMLKLVGNLYWFNVLLQVIACIFFGRVFYLFFEKPFISNKRREILRSEAVE
jgi:peptidoglycan/LPS O-acetylase OafA/YrhL